MTHISSRYILTSKLIFLLSILAFLFALPLIAADQEWKLGLKGFPQPDNAGFYMADSTGTYKEQGLKVAIVHPTWDKDSAEMLKDDEIDFAIARMDTVIARIRKGEQLVILGQFMLKSPRVLICPSSAKLSHIYELNGKRIASSYPKGALGIKNFLKQLGVEAQYIKTQQEHMALLYHAVDAAESVSYNDLEIIPFYGQNLTNYKVFALHDYGLIMPEYVLYTKQSTWATHPEICQRLLTASIAGWKRCFQQTTATLIRLQNTCKQHNIPFSYAQNRNQLKALSELIISSPEESGISLESFQQTARLLEWHLMPAAISQLYHAIVPFGKMGISPLAKP